MIIADLCAEEERPRIEEHIVGIIVFPFLVDQHLISKVLILGLEGEESALVREGVFAEEGSSDESLVWE